MYSIQHVVIKFVSHLRHVVGFLPVLWFPPPIKLTATIYLKHDLKHHNPNQNPLYFRNLSNQEYFIISVRKQTTTSGGNCLIQTPLDFTTTTPQVRRLFGTDLLTVILYLLPSYRYVLLLSVFIPT